MELGFNTDMWGVLDLVHDRWFDLAQVQFDRQQQEVTFLLGERHNGPFTDRILKFTGVSSVTIKDEAEIGVYDLCDIVPNYVSSSIRITSGFPLEIVLEIKQRCIISILKPEQSKE